MVIIRHIAIRPRTQEIPSQLNHLLPQRLLHLRRRIPTPLTIRPQRSQIPIKLRQSPRHNHGNGSRQDQPRRSSKGTLSHGRKATQGIAIAGLLERLEGADVAGEEGEDGDSDTALPGDAEDGPLQDSGWEVFGVAREEEVVVPGAG